MPRRPLLLTDKYPYHITSRSNNKDWFYIPPEEAWDIFNSGLLKISNDYGVRLFAFVLMSNHFHLILETPHCDLGDVMRDFMTFVSKKIQKSAQRINHVFGSRYKWSLLDSSYAIAYVLKYVLRNPVRANMIKRVEDFPYSSITTSCDFPLVSGIGPLWARVPKSRECLLQWLNSPTGSNLEHQITLGLRRSKFEFSKDNSNQKAIRELMSNYLPR